MEAGPLPGGANVWSLEPGDWRRRCEDLLVLRIALSRHSDCYRIVIFLLPIGDDRPKSAVPAHDPRLQKEAKALETRQEVDWAATPSCAANKKSSRVGGRPPLFPIVIYNAGC